MNASTCMSACMFECVHAQIGGTCNLMKDREEGHVPNEGFEKSLERERESNR